MSTVWASVRPACIRQFVRWLRRTRGVCPCSSPTNSRGSYKVLILGWTRVLERVTSDRGATNTIKNKKRTHVRHTEAGGGRNRERMKFKASGGENLHAAISTAFSSGPSASYQQTRLIGLEELEWEGWEEMGWGWGGLAFPETWQQMPTKLLHIPLATTGEQTTVSLDWSVWSAEEFFRRKK